ncbi:hypothetical protein [Sandaracinus amylolyticus]|uniref:hypothetical protein n=1 Tax=Sandaracinus amylolyticus TaxID=927083 RepID=UPI001F1D628B|nr:hypothetical protein [Sandaracinus amylolyticus]UJR82944.1 Hypothetical protein I5071_50090 [Sandaracinus amylolyticus]
MKVAPHEALVFVYDGRSGIAAIALDVVKKLAGREDCALCEITYGPTGKRGAWRECERRLELPIEERHRDDLPPAWAARVDTLPCVLLRRGDSVRVLLDRDRIEACGRRPEALELAIRDALRASA